MRQDCFWRTARGRLTSASHALPRRRTGLTGTSRNLIEEMPEGERLQATVALFVLVLVGMDTPLRHQVGNSLRVLRVSELAIVRQDLSDFAIKVAVVSLIVSASNA